MSSPPRTGTKAVQSSGPTAAQAPARLPWAIVGFLLVAIWLIYGQTLDFALLGYDDGGFVYNNPQITAGITAEGIRWAFADGPFGEWYPLATLSHMLDCQLFGLNAWGHHLTNVLLHAATSIGLFLVLWRMTGELWPSAFVAMLFAVHPQHVESVAWVAERRDVLSGLFFVLTLAAYLGYVRHGRTLGRYLLVVALLALGADGQADAGHAAAAAVAVGFLAAGPVRLGRRMCRTGRDRSSGLGCGGWCWKSCRWLALAAADCLMTLRTHYAVRASRWAGRGGSATRRSPRSLTSAVFLSGRSGGVLSVAAGRTARLESGRRIGDPGCRSARRR